MKPFVATVFTSLILVAIPTEGQEARPERASKLRPTRDDEARAAVARYALKDLRRDACVAVFVDPALTPAGPALAGLLRRTFRRYGEPSCAGPWVELYVGRVSWASGAAYVQAGDPAPNHAGRAEYRAKKGMFGWNVRLYAAAQ